MNLNAVVVSQLKKRRAAMVARHATELAPIDAALAAFGGGGTSTAQAPVVKRRRRRKLSPEAIAKMQEGRKRAREAAQAGSASAAPAAPAKRESRPRLSQGPKGASLAAAAE